MGAVRLDRVGLPCPVRDLLICPENRKGKKTVRPLGSGRVDLHNEKDELGQKIIKILMPQGKDNLSSRFLFETCSSGDGKLTNKILRG